MANLSIVVMWQAIKSVLGLGPDARRAAVRRLASAPKPDCRRIVAALRDPDAGVRQAAAHALGRIKDARARGPLLKVLWDPDTGVRARAADALHAIGWRPETKAECALDAVARADFGIAATYGAAAVDPLVAALDAGPSSVRIGVIEALGSVNDPRVSTVLISALKFDDPTVRVAVMAALGKTRQAPDVAALLGRLNDPAFNVRVAAIESLGEIGDATAVEPLVARLLDGAWQVRIAAVEALGKLNDSRAVEALINALNDSDLDVCEAAAHVLGRRQIKEGIGPLVRTLIHKHAPLGNAADAALPRITPDWHLTQAARELLPELQAVAAQYEQRQRHVAAEAAAKIEQGLGARPGER
jgi:HEAT repeat protein